MEREDVLAFVQRDWRAVERSKEDYWVEQRKSFTLDDLLAMSSALRQQAIAMRPDRPTREERRADLEHHARMASLLSHVPRQPDP